MGSLLREPEVSVTLVQTGGLRELFGISRDSADPFAGSTKEKHVSKCP